MGTVQGIEEVGGEVGTMVRDAVIRAAEGTSQGGTVKAAPETLQGVGASPSEMARATVAD